MTYSPKQRLLDQPGLAKPHMDVVATESFLRSAEAALLDMVMNAEDTTNPNIAVVEYGKILGARDYLRSLLNIADPKPLPPRRVFHGLEREPT